MNEGQGGPNVLLDTTDCLEAVGVFRGWKNFFFLIVLLCMLLLQGSFWLVETGYVQADGVKSDTPAVVNEDEGKIDEAARDVNADANQPVADANKPVTDANKPVAAAQKPVRAVSKKPVQKTKSLFGLNITFEHLVWVINIANAVLILASVLYCLAILFSLKVSLIGRLGGISHISRAFFVSLIMVVLLIPWQKIFGCMVIGAIFTPCELVKCRAVCLGSEMLGIVLYYLRFSGFMVLTLLLLLLSQMRTCRWTRAILRRLEVI